jgi:hypothetical protein
MHIQQSKAESRATGGPQYWFEGEPAYVTNFLEQKRTCTVILMTPYGPVETPFVLVHEDYKLMRDGRLVSAHADHHRIQKGQSKESIGEAIRRWFALRSGYDFERIELDDSRCFDKQSRLILIPLTVKWRGRVHRETLPAVRDPLSFTSQHRSDLWLKQIEACRRYKSDALSWAASQLKRFVEKHNKNEEKDLLRIAGALDQLGLALGPYMRTGYDCPESSFRFLDFPEYRCAVEIKTRSRGFEYEIHSSPTRLGDGLRKRDWLEGG